MHALRQVWWRLVYSPLLRLGGEAFYRVLPSGPGGRPPLYQEVVPGAISRSAQPDGTGFRWLRERGVRSVVNLRLEDDVLPWLRALHFDHYLHVPLPEGVPLTDEEAETLLVFVSDPAHWPVHIHCLTGIQRTGIVVALIRYARCGWTLERALAEARSFAPGPTRPQIRWLRSWAARHRRGSHHPGGEPPWSREDVGSRPD